MIRAFGLREELHRQFLPTIYINSDYGTYSLTVCDDSSSLRLRHILLETELSRYTITSRYVHEISLVGGDTLVLQLSRSDANVSAFCDAIEYIARSMGRFSSSSQVGDSDGSGSGLDDEFGPPGAMAVAPEEARVPVMWDCWYCHLTNLGQDQTQCNECGRYKDDS